ncbi:acetyl-CoA carboxylase biotin carboxylase subunit [Candidatus Termititenax persephonae]|uniref:Biotin carboxylase n=1 Tax=Candidatus Termititenax persephonae TaxID=2218525 RepID=A0A388TI19_9BACT|nr:acetyl-CoA carboxylase biotin carboxylase subunit [Candidatus Termititenax persephonae]
MFKKVLIANRGEIALRIIRACQELQIPTVAVFSEVDRDSLPVRLADEAYCIGPAAPKDSYLGIPRLIAVAEMTGADALHPGYGFLAENAAFAEICQAHNIKFIGPSVEAIRGMGDKANARQTMQAAGIPCTPGSPDIIPDADAAKAVAENIGYPLLIKATAGGGGRGMRIVESPADLAKMFASASEEAKSCFGNGSVYLEKYILQPRHIEMQILADQHGHVVWLGERDCSVQRRHQKLIEEAPSIFLPPEARQQMGEAAVKAAQAVNYEGAGTVEFLVDADWHFYFMEMNTRIQVEHCVTERVTGIDLIKEQIKIAAGKPLGFKQSDVHVSGHAIEFRINAEDWKHNFRPAPGQVNLFLPPGGPGVRVDSHVYPGYKIPSSYDSLLAKLIVWGNDRTEALERSRRVLNEFVIDGVPTTIPFHKIVLDNPYFIRGDVQTDFLDKRVLNGQA